MKRASAVDVHVGQRLRERRNELERTQDSLANAVGLTFQQIQKYEKGTNRVSASRLQQFADILDVDVSWFFEGAPGSKKVTSEDQISKSVREFTDLPDARQLMRAFMRIDDKELRRYIAQLVERLAETA